MRMTPIWCWGALVGGQEPPADRAASLDFIAEFAPRHALAAVRAGEPLGEVTHYRIPSNRWRRYDKLARTPDGLWFSATPFAASIRSTGRG